jgi:hypothetical protein
MHVEITRSRRDIARRGSAKLLLIPSYIIPHAASSRRGYWRGVGGLTNGKNGEGPKLSIRISGAVRRDAAVASHNFIITWIIDLLAYVITLPVTPVATIIPCKVWPSWNEIIHPPVLLPSYPCASP